MSMPAASSVISSPGVSVTAEKSTTGRMTELRKLPRTICGVVDLFNLGFRAHGKRDHFSTKPFGCGQSRVRQLESWMCPHRLRPVDERFDSTFGEMSLQEVAVVRLDHVILKDIAPIELRMVWQPDARRSGQPGPVAVGNGPPMLDPARKVVQLYVEHSRLDVVQQRRGSVVVILPSLSIFAVVPEQAGHAGHIGLVGRDGSAIPKTAENFEWIEAETACDSEASGSPGTKARAKRLGGVLDDQQAMPVGDGLYPGHVAHAAIQMDRQQHPRAARNRALDRLRIDEIVVADFDEHRRGPCVDDGRYRCHERMADRNYLVWRTDAGSQQRKVQRVVSAVDPDGVFHADERGEMLFEVAQLFAVYEVAVRQDRENRVVLLDFEAAVMITGIDEGHAVGHQVSWRASSRSAVWTISVEVR